MGPVPGMTAKEIKKYIRYIADWRLGQLGFQPIYMIDEHPLPWLAPLLNGVEHANFFETRATEYSKAATRLCQACRPQDTPLYHRLFIALKTVHKENGY
jgi:ribonucleoside-diphosphate reductase beta chain